MGEPQEILNLIPKTNYSTVITMANYLLTKQMIDQVLSEDNEYVQLTLKSLRTGGTMDTYFENGNNGKHYMDDHYDYRDEYQTRRKQRKLRDSNNNEEHINKIPNNSIFPKDIRDERQNALHFPRILDQDEQFRLLVTNLDAEQTNRFEVFHRTSLNKTQIKKVASTVLNQSVTENVRVFLQAVGKIFAGEIIELSLDVKQKWLAAKMTNQYHQRKIIGKRLKKFLKKLTLLVESNEEYDDSVDEAESDTYFDDDIVEMKHYKAGNKLLKEKYQNTQESKLALIDYYNNLVKQFNVTDVSMEKYKRDSPILPEHVREAWRLYQLQSKTLPSAKWRTQGEGNGWMFR